MLERIIKQISKEIELSVRQVQGTVALLDSDNTVPFITRYRKEITGGLDEEQIRAIEDRLHYLRNLETRKQEILQKISEQKQLTPELEAQILQATQLKIVEDLYLPYRPKKRTRATIAKEKGLEPLAGHILAGSCDDPEQLVAPFISADKEVPDSETAWKGAMDIVAEKIAEDIQVRQAVRHLIAAQGMAIAQKTTATSDKEQIYQDYFDYQEPLTAIPAHRVLAMDRGESEGVLRIKIQVGQDEVWRRLEALYLKNPDSPLAEFADKAIKDSYKRLIAPAISREIRKEMTEKAHLQAISVFASNLRNLLLQRPLKHMQVLAIDPGYSSGCKLALLSDNGDLLAYDVIYPHPPQKKSTAAQNKVLQYHRQYQFQVVVIGNGTACRETEEFIAKLIEEHQLDLVYTIVNEAGASVYSASAAARDEFPELDASYRGTISIGRRLLDPLAELVKIDPKSLGVGMYQHDVNARLLEKALHTVVESVVNYVGVDLNRASVELLSYVAGINRRCAKNILALRKKSGGFSSRFQLKEVAGIGEEVFTQCAGFLRVAGGSNPLDNTAIHPESYPICQRLLAMVDELPEKLDKRQEVLALKLSQFNAKQLACQLEVGEPTLRDILDNLRKPGRDPRDDVPPPIFRREVLTLDDLEPEMELEGTVRNVTDFGAFVDIGVKVDGLVHISRMANYYVKNPMDICKVGDTVRVKVVNVDINRKRIGLSMQ